MTNDGGSTVNDRAVGVMRVKRGGAGGGGLSVDGASMVLAQIGPGFNSTSPQSRMSRAASRRRSNEGAGKQQDT